MQGLMQGWPLTLDRIVDHAAAAHPEAEILTAAIQGAPRRITYADFAARVRRLAAALAESGVRRGEGVAVIGANSARQLEAWYAIVSLGAICHPLSPALSPARTASAMRAAGDKAAFIDPDLLAKLEPVLLKLPRLERVIAMAEPSEALDTGLQGVVSQDVFAAAATGDRPGPAPDETSPAVLIQTVGAAGSSSSIAWSHRSCVLQGMIAQSPEGLDLGREDSVLVLSPFWRAAAWGLVFAAPMAGARLVLPAARTDAQSVRILTDRVQASLIAASPFELQALLDQFKAEGRRPTGLERAIAAGAACPPALAKAWRDGFDVDVQTVWGTAEVGGLAAVAEAGARLRPLFGAGFEIFDADGRKLAHDGATVGLLKARGPEPDGFIDTGDLASIDAAGRLALLGRADEQIMAGGDLAPSWPIEAAALDHPASARVAAIDPPPGLAAQGPVLLIARKPGALAGKADYLRFLNDRLGGLALGEVLFVDGFPLDAAGRVDKHGLRERLERLAAPVPPPAAVAAPLPEPQPEPEPGVESAPPSEPPPQPWSEPEPEEAPDALETASSALLAAAPAAAALYHSEPPEPLEPAEAAGPPAPAPEVHAPIYEEAARTAASAPSSEPAVEAAPAAPAASEEEAAAEAPAATIETPPPASVAEEAPAPAAETPEPGLFIHFEPRPASKRGRKPSPRREPEDRAGLVLTLTTLLGCAPLALIVAGALGVRLDLIDWRVGLGRLILDWPFKLALIGMLGGLVAIFTAMNAGFRRYRIRTVASVALPLAVLVGVSWLKSQGEAYPPVHDVSTDWADPVTFSPALIKARGPDAYPVDLDPIVPATAGAYMNRRVAEVNAETCPAARPVDLPLPPGQAYDRAKDVLKASGLDIVTADPAAGRLEATGAGLWLGLKDDLAVRVRPGPQGARVDLRSVSRAGLSDFGANCDRVTRLAAQIAGAGAN